jgi:hypothetical protein
MHLDHEHLDQELILLERSIRGGDHMTACLQLAEFSLVLDHYIRCEERAMSTQPAPPWNAKIQREHTSMRRLVALIACALDRADDRRSAEVTSLLRSVLLLHAAKEQSLFSDREWCAA